MRKPRRSDCLKAMNDIIGSVPMTSVVSKIVDNRPEFKNPWDVGWIRLPVRDCAYGVGAIYVLCFCIRRSLIRLAPDESLDESPSFDVVPKLEIRQLRVLSEGRLWVDQCPDCGLIYWAYRK